MHFCYIFLRSRYSVAQLGSLVRHAVSTPVESRYPVFEVSDPKNPILSEVWLLEPEASNSGYLGPLGHMLN